MTSINRALLLKGTPEMLGLTKLPFPASDVNQRVQFTSLKRAGVATFDDLEAYLIQNAQEAGIAQPYLCVVHSGVRHADGFFYDFPGRSVCYPSHVRAGDPYTSISFNEYAPVNKPIGPWVQKVPEFVVNHNEWFVMMDTEDDKSHARISWGILHWLPHYQESFWWWYINVQHGMTTALVTRTTSISHAIQRLCRTTWRLVTYNLLAALLVTLIASAFSPLLIKVLYARCRSLKKE
jgi:hypothetical protein